MPAKTPKAAADALRSDFQRAVSCVTRAVLVASGSRPPGPHSLAFPGNGGPVRLDADPEVRLLVRLRYVVEPVDAEWIARPTDYQYALIDGDSPELIAYHLHPGGASQVAFPHLHAHLLTRRFDLRGTHFPTGLVPLAAVIRCAIDEIGVSPLRPDWEALLKELIDSAS